mmetsp:Transcript_34794/g.96078  ORF Transcript_34794/g.96078 Transcript_34794/m.96078 type:complete len:102 (-) Transcript_34794:344-649(-)
MIAVVMDPACKDTSQWQGVVGLRLGSSLYVDLSMDENAPEFDANLQQLVGELRSLGSDSTMKEGTTPRSRLKDAARTRWRHSWAEAFGRKSHQSPQPLPGP